MSTHKTVRTLRELTGRLAAVLTPPGGAYKSGFYPEFPALHHAQIFLCHDTNLQPTCFYMHILHRVHITLIKSSISLQIQYVKH